MNLSETIRKRSSVRHYSEQNVPDYVIQQTIEEASWAPSAGNTQPWQIAVLSQEAAKTFQDKYEALGWESVLPSLRIAILSHQTGKSMTSKEINQNVMDTYHQHAVTCGNPRIIIVYYNKKTIADLLKFASAALSLFKYRTENTSFFYKRAASFLQLILRSKRDWRIAKDAVIASLANFTYAVTLCAKERGLDTCIQFSYNHAYTWLRKDIGLTNKQALFGVILIGYRSKNDSIEAVNSRTRKPVEINWINYI